MQQVGTINVSKPFEETDSYECAAWYKKWETDTGVFPIYENDEGRLIAKIPATCTGSNFTSLFGGVACGSPKVDEEVGDRKDMTKVFPKSAAFTNFEIAIEPEHIGRFVDDVLEEHGDKFEDDSRRIATEYAPNATRRSGTSGEPEGTVSEGKYDEYRIGWAKVTLRQMMESASILETLFHPTPTDRHQNLDEVKASWEKKYEYHKQLWESNRRHHERVQSSQ